MREYIAAQIDPLRNLISTTALLLLSSVITETTAFSLNHEALITNHRTGRADNGEAIVAVTGVSKPLVDKAISFFDSVDGPAANWPVANVFNSEKVSSPHHQQLIPFKPFLAMQPFTLPPPQPQQSFISEPIVSADKNQGVFIPQPPQLPAPLQVSIIDDSSENGLMTEPLEGGNQEAKPSEPSLQQDEIPLNEPLQVHPNPPLIISPSQQTYPQSSSVNTQFIPSEFGWHHFQPPPYLTSGESQQISLNVNGNLADYASTSNVYVEIISSDESHKHT